jgi:uncharacterized glyoxalase superfamily protein PhnB
MRAFQPYLNFDGNTRDAMTFYQKCGMLTDKFGINWMFNCEIRKQA